MINKLIITSLSFGIFLSSPVYSAYCDDGDIVDFFDSGVWKLDLTVITGTGDGVTDFEFMFTLDERNSKSMKLSRVYKFPKVNTGSKKRHYFARKIIMQGGKTDVTPLKITNFNFKQLREVYLNPIDTDNQSQRSFCVYQINIDSLQQYSEDDNSEYNAKFRLFIHANETQQSYQDRQDFDIEPTSYFYEYNEDPNTSDKMVLGTLKKVELTL